MKITLLITAFCAVALHVSAQKKITYEFPKEMLPEVQVEYRKLCDKGKILYELNCAKCHNIPKGRKEIIPDFEVEQLSGYAIRVSNGDHEMNLPEEQVTPEELALISNFLTYKKKSGVKAGKPVGHTAGK